MVAEVPRFGRVFGIIAIHESLGYLILVGDRQPIRGGGASRRIAAGVIVATVAVLLIAGGCGTEPASSAEEVVAAGDIASCRTGADEATAELVEGIDGTVLVLGDEASPRGSAANFEECYGPSWGRFKERTRPVPGNHEYYTEGARGYFEYFGEAAGDPEETIGVLSGLSDGNASVAPLATSRATAVDNSNKTALLIPDAFSSREEDWTRSPTPLRSQRRILDQLCDRHIG